MSFLVPEDEDMDDPDDKDIYGQDKKIQKQISLASKAIDRDWVPGHERKRKALDSGKDAASPGSRDLNESNTLPPLAPLPHLIPAQVPAVSGGSHRSQRNVPGPEILKDSEDSDDDEDEIEDLIHGKVQLANTDLPDWPTL
ncbi:hypothetical protein BS47DRAFT_1399496 [Hydnum rufescens UP504]|uniref:Uncharacterized protein n=1 Tax=Hydnum rufescens UP504 TaxID=1448309 RepID=A0A9P6DPL7_9AGAM|nr:hypothetical protein BS47DRAFT_1399496 [Hydnum rufescens UP504]